MPVQVRRSIPLSLIPCVAVFIGRGGLLSLFAVGCTDVFKIHLECQQQVIETAPARVEEGKCFFNEVFSFEIGSREGDLRICLVKVDSISRAEELVGDCSVLLEDLAGKCQFRYQYALHMHTQQSAPPFFSSVRCI